MDNSLLTVLLSVCTQNAKLTNVSDVLSSTTTASTSTAFGRGGRILENWRSILITSGHHFQMLLY